MMIRKRWMGWLVMAALILSAAAAGQESERRWQILLGGQTLTFHFPTADAAPQATVAGNAAVIGKQRITLKDGNLILKVAGR